MLSLTTKRNRAAAATVEAADGVKIMLQSSLSATNVVGRRTNPADCLDCKEIHGRLEECRAIPPTSAAKAMLRAYLVLIKTSQIPAAPASVLNSLVVPRNNKLPEIPPGVAASDKVINVVVGNSGGRVLDRAQRKAAKLSINMLAAPSDMKRFFAPRGGGRGALVWGERVNGDYEVQQCEVQGASEGCNFYHTRSWATSMPRSLSYFVFVLFCFFFVLCGGWLSAI